MRVVIFVVNFHADDHVRRLWESIAAAQAEAPGTRLEVHILDNSMKSDGELDTLRTSLGHTPGEIHVHSTGTNSGYFGPLPLAQALVSGEPDYVIYSNPDLVVAPDFLQVLSDVRPQAGIVAPSIVASDQGFDQNPMYVDRLTEAKLRRLRVAYSSRAAFAVHMLAWHVAEVVRRARRRAGAGRRIARPATIYAPYGSLFLFADVPFFLGLPPYPCFLFGEELFIAEEARLRGLKIVYEPRLRVDDVRQVSISKLRSDTIRGYLRESIVFILSRYYETAPEGGS